ncbi:hypothetical protein ARMSODRAFT_1025414 [Armillaria solidipes]|uniref:Uncharacterized protein n=1 Tax=Armillaria solidipes TaxID=1076256 RepID=A0A2H3B6M9_9AGAR|nr:hypothetical protein ARMSODRAFT_1025414 [Armillaria solidipes]
MSFASPPHNGSRWLSLKYPRYTTLRRRYHPYTRPRLVLLPPSPLLSSNKIVHEEFTKQALGMVDGPAGRWKTVLAVLAALAIFIRVVENVCRCDVI